MLIYAINTGFIECRFITIFKRLTVKIATWVYIKKIQILTTLFIHTIKWFALLVKIRKNTWFFTLLASEIQIKIYVNL